MSAWEKAFRIAGVVTVSLLTSGCGGAGAPSIISAQGLGSQTVAYSVPTESLVDCFARVAGSNRPSSLMALTAGKSGASGKQGRQFRERRLLIGPDVLAQYTSGVLRASARTGVTAAEMNAKHKQNDLTCLRTQVMAAKSTLGSKSDGAKPHIIDQPGLKNFVHTNGSLSLHLTKLYKTAGDYLQIRDREDIPEQIARGFQEETLILVDNSGLISHTRSSLQTAADN